MIPVLAGVITWVVIVGGWTLWYKLSLMRLGDEAGVFKMVGILFTPVIILAATGISVYVALAAAVPSLIDWIHRFL